ncbi:MAG: flippase-like domain-containing protein [Dehalococcoidia bacterium]
MQKRQVLTQFVLLAFLAVCGGFAVHFALAKNGLGDIGFLLDVAVVLGVGAVAFGCFSPNSPLFGRVISGRPIGPSMMALTFDDGPSPETTPRVLEALRAANAKATFFVLGKHAERHPELVRRISEEGHEVASHGWTHNLLVFASPATVRRELENTSRLIEGCGVPAPRLFRAPHGFRRPLLAREIGKLGMRVVGWSKGVFDTALPGPDVIAARSAEAMRPGAILLLHDGDGNGSGDRSQTADALPAILKTAKDRGLRTVTVSELAAYDRGGVSWLRVGAFAAVLLTVLAVIFYRVGPGRMDRTLELIAGLNLGLVTAAVLANLVSIALKAVVWKETLDSVPSRPPVKYPHLVSAVFVGFLMNSILVARAGEVARIVVLKRRIKRETGVVVPFVTIAGTVIAETLVLVGTLVLILAVAVFTIPGLPSQVMTGTLILLAATVVLAVAMVVIELIAKARRRRSAQRASRADGLFPFLAGQIERLLHEVQHGHQLFLHPARATVAIGAGLVSWIANLIAIWFTLLAFGITKDAFAAAVVVFAVSNLIGIVPLTPGNVGVFQVAVSLALASGFGVSRGTGLSFGIGLQAIEVGLGAGLGLAFLSIEGLNISQVQHEIKDAEAPPDAAQAQG